MAAIEAAESFEPPPETLEETVARLAALPALEYDQVREAEARRLNVRIGTLDKEVAKARGQAGAEDSDAADFLIDPEPWPEPVDGADLLDRIVDAVNAHMVMPRGAAESMALWVLHAHAHDCFLSAPFSASPARHLNAASPRC